MSYNKTNSIFNLEDDVDDKTFLQKNKLQQPDFSYNNIQKKDSAIEEFQRKQKFYLQNTLDIQESSLASTKSALRLLNESEHVGAKTAEQLLNQREQLEKVDQNLDIINGGLKQTQKNLNSMKGFFNGLKSLWRADKPLNNENNKLSNSQSVNTFRENNELSKCVDKIRSNSTQYSGINHPALNARGVNRDSVLEDNVDKKSKFHSVFDKNEAELDENLSDIQLGIGRLKSLALGLDKEITEQNEFLDSIASKTEKVDDTLKFQNKQMHRFLGK